MLATYNRLTEKCFTKCISNMNSDKLTGIEVSFYSTVYIYIYIYIYIYTYIHTCKLRFTLYN